MKQTKPKFTSLRRRIMTQFCLFALVLSAVYGAIAFVLMWILEDSFIQREITHEAEYLQQGFKQQGQWPVPRKDYMTLYFSVSQLPEDIRDTVIRVPNQREFFGADKRHYHLHRFPDAPNTFLVSEVSQMLIVRYMTNDVLWFMGFSGVVVSLIACLIAWFISRKTIRPLRQLVQVVGGADPNALPRRFADQFPNDEVGILADSLEQSMQRIATTLERERCFTRDVSHELRTPLAIIKNAVEVHRIRKGSDQNVVIERIADAAIAMEKTVETLLVLAREEHTQAKKETFNVMPLVEKSVVGNAHLLEGKAVEVEIDDSCNREIFAQSGMLMVLLNNLLGNAFQYTQSGRVEVFFSGNQLVVQDTGCGIEPAISDNIMEPAVKGSQSTGFGFGLSIVKRLCEHQGWILNVESQQGTRVSVSVCD
ncbi:two-component sensor histidine kinase [Veronia nyctiphanis]|uniref:histidine kinase n=1 Tax=Veronia nyctiphanis TaxID=1278244 RepID=A0A4Q0YRX7_9GAMM|nr:HAMP domain-containing sensor histidine kinase [Veronia nyctiphanis]RXJ73960.1 two-component sensor histidine kinase [Veronia nyctiphanis]